MAARTSAGPGYRDAVARLSTAQKTSKGAPAYSRYINRRLGRYLAALAHQAGLRPNQVTAISAVCTFSGIATAVLAGPGPLAAIVIPALLILGYALDSADGQLARLTGGGSPAGEWLDHTVDAFKVGSIHLAVLVCWWRFFPLETAWLLVPLIFQVAATVHFVSTLLMDQLRRGNRAHHGTLVAGDGHSSALYSLAVVPTDFGLMCLVFFLFAWPAAFVGVYSALCAATVAFLLLALRKWYREVKAWN
ncbi:CDP-alcohol phosphatidyltransferase family protein [Arthrobacter sp. YD2]|uniref:CDP-alcohol phosphatidyltransferase family protein n=1 Tax=Arthrobacter sp. YD2 TaxID=3058046 RepID=UPI0025B42334|nr:CDP-alcohol phosphatidyltransferase family protein [Arthrobacter sp. YD2]MDN3905261.1 CDP-alcohol phosphatidyltransferase family protein [Arthrobacter sp. YD2]